jgi:hypothetical protein
MGRHEKIARVLTLVGEAVLVLAITVTAIVLIDSCWCQDWSDVAWFTFLTALNVWNLWRVLRVKEGHIRTARELDIMEADEGLREAERQARLKELTGREP